MMSLSDQLIIRKAVVTDLPQMLTIMDAALDEPSNANEMPEPIERWSSKLNNASQFIFYVVEIQPNYIIGWCRGGQSIEYHRMVENESYEYEIHNIFIHPEHQNREIGRQLWWNIWNDLIEHYHPQNLVAWSVDKKKTQRFYVSLGGQQQEQKRFDGDCILTAFTWHNLKLLH